MKGLVIKRIASRSDGMLGVMAQADFGLDLEVLGELFPFALTLERPWADNEPRVSCIPAGIYLCKRVQSPKFGNTFEITGVDGRSAILFHKGNHDDDSLGCVLVGEEFAVWEDGSASIARSGAGFGEMLARFADVNEFYVRILEV